MFFEVFNVLDFMNKDLESDLHLVKKPYSFKVSWGDNWFYPLSRSKNFAYSTPGEARQKALDPDFNWEMGNSMFVVLKNADFTEGRGPMLLDRLFHKFDNAVDYVMQQSGISGTKQGRSIYYGISLSKEVFCQDFFNGYQIEAKFVED
jgi:hypothetical protein